MAARVSRIAVAAAIGGTVSELTGGKFANGAITAAFARAFNDEAHMESSSDDSWFDISIADLPLLPDGLNN
ncbi:MAG: hypothetical protein ACK4E7_11435 [Permianibacter sp.]